jgi:hypothetical protein
MNNNIYLGIIIILIYIIIYLFYLFISNKPNKFICNKPLYDLIFKKDFIEIKYNQLYKYLGNYKFTKKDSDNKICNIIWTEELDKNVLILGKYHGLDYIELTSNIRKSHHPQILKMFIIIGKYIYIPKNLYNIILSISATINIEQINIPIKYNELYIKKGKLYMCLLKINCPNITIGSITIKLIEDIIELYKNKRHISNKIILKINDEYNQRILNYINSKEIIPDITWFNRYKFDE